MMSLNPVSVYNHGADEEKAEIARMSSFVGAIAIGDLVKSTLGPKGMDKILISPGANPTAEPGRVFALCARDFASSFPIFVKEVLENFVYLPRLVF